GSVPSGRSGRSGGREANLHDLAFELSRARDDRDGSAVDRELAGLLRLRSLRIAEVVQTVDELLDGEGLAAIDLQRPRKYLRKRLVPLAVEALIDEAGEGGVVITEHTPGDHAEDKNHHQ